MTSTDPLDAASAELLARLTKETTRLPDTPSTERVGGVAKVGSRLERLLRLAVEDLARAAHVEPASLLPPGVSRKPSISKASEGQLVFALRKAGHPSLKGIGPGTAAVIAELRAKSSAIDAFVQFRNRALHEGVVADDADKVLGDLRRATEALRVTAGWSVSG